MHPRRAAKPESLLELTDYFRVNESEDCLILNVLVPANPVLAGLPFLVQIHSGGCTLGNT